MWLAICDTDSGNNVRNTAFCRDNAQALCLAERYEGGSVLYQTFDDNGQTTVASVAVSCEVYLFCSEKNEESQASHIGRRTVAGTQSD